MRFEAFSFGSIRIDGVTYEHDVVIDHGQVRKRKKKASKRFRDAFGHTPLSMEEDIPWKCRRLGYDQFLTNSSRELKADARLLRSDLAFRSGVLGLRSLASHERREA